MDYEKVLISRVDPNDHVRIPTSEHFFANIVFLNRTHHALQPLLYHLKDDQPSAVAQYTQMKVRPVIDSKAFVLMGEVLDVDKKRKQIHLSNDNTVTYNFLIEVTVPNENMDERSKHSTFSGGMHTLIDALKMRQRVLVPLPAKVQDPKAKHVSPHSPDRGAKSSSIEQIAKPNLIMPDKTLVSLSLVQNDKKYYQVQL